MIFAYANENIYYRGKLVAITSKDIFVGDPVKAEMFVVVEGEPLKAGDPVPEWFYPWLEEKHDFLKEK